MTVKFWGNVVKRYDIHTYSSTVPYSSILLTLQFTYFTHTTFWSLQRIQKEPLKPNSAFVAMKSFARLFFALGLLTGLYLYVFPDALKIVCIPADDSILTKRVSAEGIHESEEPTSQAEVNSIVRKEWL